MTERLHYRYFACPHCGAARMIWDGPASRICSCGGYMEKRKSLRDALGGDAGKARDARKRILEELERLLAEAQDCKTL